MPGRQVLQAAFESLMLAEQSLPHLESLKNLSLFSHLKKLIVGLLSLFLLVLIGKRLHKVIRTYS
jgi:hypothetical protein